MEVMPYQPQVEPAMNPRQSAWDMPVSSDWRDVVPVLGGITCTIREVQISDAPSLFAMLTTEEVSRFISPPPSTVEGFERFIRWCHGERTLFGRYVCFAVVPEGCDFAVGLIQVREIEPHFSTAEWGVAIGSQYWGTGVIMEAAQMAVDFVFDVLGVHRLEARAAVLNGRANAALRKLGAVQEGVLRRSLLKNGAYYDQVLWSIIDDEWRQTRDPNPVVH